MKRNCILLIMFIKASFLFSGEIQNTAVYLVSYPRSGNTWMRYCIEYLTKRPTGSPQYMFPVDREGYHNMKKPLNNFFPYLNVDYSKPPVVKLHHPPKGRKQYLILILRDYKECILRNDARVILEKEVLHQNLQAYLKNLRCFDRWPKEKRLLIYYEDLMLRPWEVFDRLVHFFREGAGNVPTFMRELAMHKKNSISIYGIQGSGPVEKNFTSVKKVEPSRTKGENLFFHQEGIPETTRRKMDDACRNLDEGLFSKYLIRYRS